MAGAWPSGNLHSRRAAPRRGCWAVRLVERAERPLRRPRARVHQAADVRGRVHHVPGWARCPTSRAATRRRLHPAGRHAPRGRGGSVRLHVPGGPSGL